MPSSSSSATKALAASPSTSSSSFSPPTATNRIKAILLKEIWKKDNASDVEAALSELRDLLTDDGDKCVRDANHELAIKIGVIGFIKSVMKNWMIQRKEEDPTGRIQFIGAACLTLVLDSEKDPNSRCNHSSEMIRSRVIDVALMAMETYPNNGSIEPNFMCLSLIFSIFDHGKNIRSIQSRVIDACLKAMQLSTIHPLVRAASLQTITSVLFHGVFEARSITPVAAAAVRKSFASIRNVNQQQGEQNEVDGSIDGGIDLVLNSMAVDLDNPRVIRATLLVLLVLTYPGMPEEFLTSLRRKSVMDMVLLVMKTHEDTKLEAEAEEEEDDKTMREKIIERCKRFIDIMERCNP